MLERLYKPSKIKASISIFMFVAAILILLPQMSGVLESLNGHNITPDSDFFYNAGRLHEIKMTYSQEGINAYVWTRFSYDLVWPLIYLFFMVATLALMLDEKTKFIRYLPLIAVNFDLLENITCSLYFKVVENQFVASLASIFSAVKWVMIIGILLIQITLFIRVLYKRISQ
ncbi:hypothetical protein EZV73_05325 [Acidaminobacter sp. JC074]|uniref:hypothetical protein n=1 Tax=Acidaminobacter sp. JC074 TaxID=2530199 RepID=UPI001F114265|nr:hypothetical protein [Acidaminobacter sp. JC074]MCH4886977.1 hypothetical protein [Acidaminobacter sp. JC074]